MSVWGMRGARGRFVFCFVSISSNGFGDGVIR
jgi:hypothetical protein